MTSAVIEEEGVSASAPRQPLKSPLTLREILTPVFYFRRQAIIAFLVPLMIACVAALFAQPVYVAQSRLLILLGDDYVFQSGVNSGAPGQTFDRPQIVHAEMEILGARDLRLKTIEAVGLARLYPALAKAPNGLAEAELALGKDLIIDNIPQSNVIELSLRNRDPKLAAEALNKLIAFYIERRREIFQQSDLASVSTQRDQLGARLAEAERAVTGFSATHHFGDYAQELVSTQTQAATLASQLQATDQQIAARSGRAAQLRAKLAATPGVMQLSADAGRSSQLDDLTRTLLALQTQRRDAAAKYTDGFPLVADLDQRIAEVQRQIAAAPTQQLTATRRGVNPVRQTLDTELADAEGDVAGLRTGRAEIVRSLATTNARLNDLVSLGPQYRDLQKTRTLVEDASTNLAKRAEDTRLTDILSRSRANVRVIQSADPPAKGTSGRLILIGAGIAAGLLAAAATVVLSLAFSEVMVTPRDVERKLALPVVLVVAEGAREPAKTAGQRPRHLKPEDSHILMRLLASVPVAAGAPKGRALQLTAAHAGEGVSALILDLALIEGALGGRKVLLMDIEPDKGRTASAELGRRGASFNRQPGERLAQVAGTNLFVSAPMQIGSMDWKAVLAKARGAFDLILVDTPPLQRGAAALSLAPHVDMTLIVVAAEGTRAAVARNLVDRIEAAGGEVLGAILNRRRFYIPRLIYGWL